MFDLISDAKKGHVAPLIDDFAVPYSKEDDLVGDVYRVQPHQPISELSNDFVRYYLATHIENNQEFFAIVFERNFSPDTALIQHIMNSSEELFVKPIAASITKLSTNKVKHLVLIVNKYDYTNNLISHYNNIGLHNVGYITTELLPFFCNVIQFCDLNDFNCGNINPENILVINDKFMLREPYVAYPHYYQSVPFLATEILDANEAGRKSTTTAPDIFAIGITLLCVYFNELPYTESFDKLKSDRLNISSFLTTIGKKRVTEDVKNQFKGCLNDNINERWKLRNLQDWASGKLSTSKNSNIPETADIFAAVSFNGHNYNHYRALASALFHEWEPGLQFLSEDRVLKWIQRGIGKSKIMEYLEELTSREYSTQPHLTTVTDKDEKLFKAIIALDTQGPLRLNGFGSTLSALANIFHFGISRQKKNFIENVIKIALKKSWEDQLRYNAMEDLDYIMIDRLTQLAQFYNNQVPGCGLERVLYHLNPALPCLSSVVYNEYITTLPGLIEALDKIATTTPDKLIFDKHIISFIANKINLKREVYINMLKDFPVQPDNSSIYGLAILVIASQYDQSLSVVNLASLLGKRIIEFIEKNLHNLKLKRNIENKIKNAAEEGDLSSILRIIANPKVYQNDQSGYYKACLDVKLMNKKIIALTNNNDVVQFGTIFGQRITVLISYLLFIIIILSMVV